MAVTATAALVKTIGGDPPRPPGHAGWNNPVGDPGWIADIDWYRRVQLTLTGSAGEYINIVNWECYDDTVPFKTSAQIAALADGSAGSLINNSDTWTVWAYTGTNVAGQAYKDTGTACVSVLRANGARTQVLLGPARKYGSTDKTYTVAAFLPGAGRKPSAKTTVVVKSPFANLQTLMGEYNDRVDNPPTGITVDPPTLAVTAGGTGAVTVALVPPTSEWAYTLVSSDPAVATVSEDGTVTGVAEGTATVTATVDQNTGLTASSAVTVGPAGPPAPTGVTVDPASANLVVAGTQQLTATVAPPEADQTVVWTSADPALATVDGAGLVTAVAAGSVNVTATAGSVSGTSAITVAAAGDDPEAAADAPTTAWLKADIIEWLVAAGYERASLDGLTKADLLATVDEELANPNG